MTWPSWVIVGLAGGYVALALYGKYRKLRADFLEAQANEAEPSSGSGRGSDVDS